MIKPPCKTNGTDCPNRAVGCQSRCEKYLAFRKKLDEANERKKIYRISADITNEAIYANRRRLKHTEAGKRALAQR